MNPNDSGTFLGPCCTFQTERPTNRRPDQELETSGQRLSGFLERINERNNSPLEILFRFLLFLFAATFKGQFSDARLIELTESEFFHFIELSFRSFSERRFDLLFLRQFQGDPGILGGM